jgi:hypothetical protein
MSSKSQKRKLEEDDDELDAGSKKLAEESSSSPVISLKIVASAEQKALANFVRKSERNVLIFGAAGSGKSTVIRLLRETEPWRLLLLAPTGIAAFNISGETIHSYFGIGMSLDENTPEGTVRRALTALTARVKAVGTSQQQLDDDNLVLVFDEFSMIPYKLFVVCDAIARKVRKRPSTPFGGLKVVLVGDPYQLEPVIKQAVYATELLGNQNDGPLFGSFPVGAAVGAAPSSALFNEMKFAVFELDQCFRQKDDTVFASILAKCRKTPEQLTRQDMKVLNSRVIGPGLAAPTLKENGFVATEIVGKLATASAINRHEFEKLQGKRASFSGRMKWPRECALSRAERGRFEAQMVRESSIETVLDLCVGAVVMVRKNISRDCVNGTIGVVVEMNADHVLISTAARTNTATAAAASFDTAAASCPAIHAAADAIHKIGYHDMTRVFMHDPKNTLTFSQIPLCLAWALTVHKTQGLSFDAAVLRLSKDEMFSCHQAYVALSRVRNLSGVFLREPINPNVFRVSRDSKMFDAFVQRVKEDNAELVRAHLEEQQQQQQQQNQQQQEGDADDDTIKLPTKLHPLDSNESYYTDDLKDFKSEPYFAAASVDV